MRTSRVRPILMLLAPAVMSLGVTACTQSPSPQTPASTTTTPDRDSAVPTSPATAHPEPAPRSVPNAPSAASTATTVRSIPSTPCVPEQRWGTGPRGGSTAMSPSALYRTRVGRHACFDRVVFDINGSEAVGFAARYVPVVSADPTGKPVPVAGRAVLQVIVRASILGADNQGHQPWRAVPTVGQSLVAGSDISGWTSLRAVRFAGSFEGQTTVAVGVREKLPFRVLVTAERGYRHVVLDIAH